MIIIISQCNNIIYWLISVVSDRQCRPCQSGWLPNANNCYAYNDAIPANRKTWEEAREDCRGKNSTLAVVHTEAEKVNLGL